MAKRYKVTCRSPGSKIEYHIGYVDRWTSNPHKIQLSIGDKLTFERVE